MKNELIFYNLCDENDISCVMVKKVIDLGINCSNLKNMTLKEFSNIYGIRKVNLFDSLQIINQKLISMSTLSVWALYHFGVSINVIKKVINKGITKIVELIVYPQAYLIHNYGLKRLECLKMYEALMASNILSFIDFNDECINSIIESFMSSPNYMKLFEEEIINIISNMVGEYISYNDLKGRLSLAYKMSDKLDVVINNLIQNKIIEFNEFGIKKYKFSIFEYLERVENSREKELLVLYLNGNTYEQIGNIYKITRERVRQLIAKALDCLPNLREDYYIKYYRKYRIDETQFTRIFNESSFVYNYLQLVGKKMGSLHYEEMLEDESLSEEIKERVMSINPKFIYINGIKIRRNIVEVLKYYLKINRFEMIKTNILADYFIEFWNKNVGEDFSRNYRRLIGAIEDSPMTISTKVGYVRTYNTESLELERFFNELDLSQYADLEISTVLIYRSYFSLMREFDIRNSYELYSIMKKSKRYNNIEFIKVPVLKIGNGNREEQIAKLIMEFAPITPDSLAKVCDDVYGFNQASIKSYIAKTFNRYYNKGYYDVYIPTISDLEALKWKNILTKDFYFISDLLEIAKENNLKFEDYYLSKNNISKIGFICNSKYIFSIKYNSGNEYFNSLLSKDIFDLADFDKRILSLSLFLECLYENIAKKRIYEISNRKFVSINYIKNFVEESLLTDFILNVKEKISKNDIFTIKYLKNNGFFHQLFNLEFDDTFYVSVLKSNAGCLVRRLGHAGEFLLKFNDYESYPTVGLLIEQILNIRQKISIDELRDYLINYYGISSLKDLWKVKEFINETNIFYDENTKMLYLNYDIFIKENNI